MEKKKMKKKIKNTWNCRDETSDESHFVDDNNKEELEFQSR